eukprot:3662566-Amphidinium_carterae.1
MADVKIARACLCIVNAPGVQCHVPTYLTESGCLRCSYAKQPRDYAFELLLLNGPCRVVLA